jgi:hypothetical protein
MLHILEHQIGRLLLPTLILPFRLFPTLNHNADQFNYIRVVQFLKGLDFPQSADRELKI